MDTQGTLVLTGLHLDIEPLTTTLWLSWIISSSHMHGYKMAISCVKKGAEESGPFRLRFREDYKVTLVLHNCFIITYMYHSTLDSGYNYIQGVHIGQIQTRYGQIQTRHWEKILHCEGGETLEQIAQQGCGCPPWKYQGHARWDFEQPGLEGGVPGYSRGLELDDRKRPFQPKPFCDSMTR